MKLSPEAKVGALVAVTASLAVAFAWLVGLQSPFNQSIDYYVTFNFAGGIEVGSPVRVSGIKAGKVEKIEFFVPTSGQNAKTIGIQEPGSDDSAGGPNGKVISPLRVKISVKKEATAGIRKDSRFYINLAGIIGERYIEITPGHFNQPQLLNGDVVAGVDPPRIDQLISQSFDLAGKIKDIIDENKGDITKSIDLLYKLSGNLNKTLDWVDKSKVFKTDLSKLVENLIELSGDLRVVTSKARTPEGDRALKLVHSLLLRLEPLDSKSIREFLQKEGVKVQLF